MICPTIPNASLSAESRQVLTGYMVYVLYRRHG